LLLREDKRGSYALKKPKKHGGGSDDERRKRMLEPLLEDYVHPYEGIRNKVCERIETVREKEQNKRKRKNRKKQ